MTILYYFTLLWEPPIYLTLTLRYTHTHTGLSKPRKINLIGKVKFDRNILIGIVSEPILRNPNISLPTGIELRNV